jgi:PAS domain S-box-containing protein
MQANVYQAILRSLSEAVCAVDPQWRIQCFNRRAELLTGVSAQNAIGKSLKTVFPDDVGEVHSIIAKVMRSAATISSMETHIVTAHGESIPVVVNAGPIVIDGFQTVTGAVLVFQDNRTVEILRRELRQQYIHGDIVSKDGRIQRILRTLPSVAQSDAPVLITGPTGTGKELLARAIHAASRRHNDAFVGINCGALPDTLLESELFGYKKGAFTDAKEDKPGRFALAEGGTLLLDEIGDVPPAMQVKLLRVLEERQYEPLGGTQSIKTDVRIIATTNQDIYAMMEAKAFRSDLYYRINVVEFYLPPLAERMGDIPLLLQHFIEAFNAQMGRSVSRVSHTALGHLMRYSYPGNIRELRNVVEHAYALCRGDEIGDECLPPRVFVGLPSSKLGLAREGDSIRPLHRMPKEQQQRVITQMLRVCNNHRGKTAEALHIDKSTLWRKMKWLGIE